jgi:SAM-dependent methyltransferase
MQAAEGPELHHHIAEFYGERYDEAVRLSVNAFGRLELARTKELLTQELPSAPARILDVGGGPGVYAAWLAALGYEVTLVDPVARHREQAAEHATFTVEPGDARALTAQDASVDAVLMLGPLYHLPDPDDRAQALQEAERVVRPGGLIAAAFISRQAPILDLASKLRINDDAILGLLDALDREGANDFETGFTVAYFHTVEEIRQDFEAAGLAEPRLFGIEGPLFPLISSGLVEDSADHFEAALRAARLADRHPELLPASAHLLAITRRAQ